MLREMPKNRDLSDVLVLFIKVRPGSLELYPLEAEISKCKTLWTLRGHPMEDWFKTC